MIIFLIVPLYPYYLAYNTCLFSKGKFFLCVWSSGRQHGKVNIDKDSILLWNQSWAGKGIITELWEEKPAESLWLVKRGKGAERSKNRLERWHWDLTGERPSWVHAAGNVTMAVRPLGIGRFHQTTCPSPSSHPTMSILLLERLHWNHYDNAFLADFAIGSTRPIPWARLSLTGRTRGVAATIRQFSCLFIPLMS